jgi:HAD superfamily hydrolase (TIGR01549 family)
VKERSIRNIIFDVDGTLVDSKRDIAAAQHWVLQQLGVDSHAPEELYPLIGKPLTETFAAFLPPNLHHRISEAAEMYKAYYPPRALETTTLFPGVKETIEMLRARGINLATATTKLTAGTRRVLQHFDIAEHFCQIQGSDEIPFKPDPAVINKVMIEQDWDRTETLMVGDTDNDIQAAQRADIRTCGVTYGSLTRDQMIALHPDFLIDRFPELLQII